MLSNAPRRSFRVVEMLKKFGITENLYDFIITSGEATFLDLQQNQQDGFKKFGQNYFYIGPQKDIDLLNGLNYQKVEKASDANFVINTGFEGDFSKIEEKLPQVIEAKKYNLPMICVNPDMIVVKQNGMEIICAGILAKEYEKIGGKIFYYGKPFKSVYEIVCKKFGISDKKKIIAIGDSLETDIKGANDFAIDSILVTGGILSNSLGIKYWQVADELKLQSICKSYQTFPKFVISNLKL
jgi:HAD superfamily hydrolase (TIGR01459 family)